MPAPSISKEQVLERLTAAFRAHGYDGASIAVLSEATGLGKASLYHYFKGGKQEMAAAVLEHVGERFDAMVLAPLRAPGAPGARLDAMIRGLEQFYLRGQASCIFDLFSIGTAGTLLRQPLDRAINRFRDTLAAVLCETGMEIRHARARAEDALVTVQGSLVVARATGDPGCFERALADLPARLLAGKRCAPGSRSP